MALKLNAYIHFDRQAQEAMEFYQSVLGGQLETSSFKDAHMEDQVAAGEQDLIMHAMLETPDGLTIMGADTPKGMNYQPGARIELSLSGGADANQKLTGFYEKLSAGGTITQPLTSAPWGDTFGMFTDKYGVGWMVNIARK